MPLTRITAKFQRRPPAAGLAAILLHLLFAAVPPTSAQQQPWLPIGPPGGNVLSLALSPQNSVYLGTADGHIFLSSDAARHWTLRARVSSRRDAVIQKLLVDRRDPQTLFAAVWFQDVSGGALYRSSDSGVTWQIAGLSGEILRTIEQSPSAPQIFVAGTRSGVFRSTDSARTWQRISPAGDPELRNVDSIAIDPRDPQTVYAGTYHLPWKTTDAGKSWNSVSSGMIDDSDVMSLRVDASSSSRVFASACSGIYRSENAGAQWTKLQGIPYSSRRTQAIVQDPQNPQALYAATTEGLWLTRDGGESWTRTTPRDWIVNDVVVFPSANSARVLLATEAQGLLVSDDAGVTFAPANLGFSHRITAALLADPAEPSHLLAWQPGSPVPLIVSPNSGADWLPLPGVTPADVAAIARLFSTASGWWLANSKGQLFFYDFSATQWQPFRFAPELPRKRSPSRSAAAARQRAIHRAAVPAKFEPPSTASQISDVITRGARVFVATPQALWCGTLDGKILRPREFSSAPGESIAQQPSASPSSVSSSPARPSPAPLPALAAHTSATLWLPAAHKILFSENEGQSWQEDPQSIASNISPGDIRWFRQAPVAAKNNPVANDSDGTVLLAATSKGLYRRDSAANTWQLLQYGLPPDEPLAFSFTPDLWLISLRSGGLYASQDAAQSWARLDVPSISGPFPGLAITRDRYLVVASLTDGLQLHPPL